jgi:signal transduction histidine kinase
MSETLNYLFDALGRGCRDCGQSIALLLSFSLVPLLLASLPRRLWFWERWQRPEPQGRSPEQEIVSRLLQTVAVLAVPALFVTAQSVIAKPDIAVPSDLVPPALSLVASLLLLRFNRRHPAWVRYILVAFLTLVTVTVFEPDYLFNRGTILLAFPMVIASLLLELRPMMVFTSLLLISYLVAAFIMIGATGKPYYADYVVSMTLMSIGFITFIVSQQKSRMIDEQTRALQIQQRALRTLSHEIRTPLVALRGFFATLEAFPHADLGPAAFLKDSAREQVIYLNDVMERLVVYARQGRVEAEAVDLAATARAVLAQMALPAQAAGVALTLGSDCGPALVTGNPGELRTILVNLVDNAVRHAGGSRVEIDVRTTRRGKALSVRDDGHGLPPDLDARLLAEPLVRESNDPRGRWGFGFWMIAEIARRSGGRLAFGPGLDGTGLGVTITFKEEVTMKQRMYRIKERLLDALTPLAGLDHGARPVGRVD